MTSNPIRVCIDGRIRSGQGGVEQVVIGLASGLSSLRDGDEQYSFLTYEGEDDWLRPHIGGACRILAMQRPLRSRVKAGPISSIPGVKSLLALRKPAVRESDGLIERHGTHVMHFTTPNAFTTKVPTIYQPHDLQHVHCPQFFSLSERRRRESLYRTHCKRAAAIIMMTDWGKTDLAAHYDLPEERIQVVPGAPILPVYRHVGSVASEARIDHKLGDPRPQRFLFYPAQTWPHKNHLGLLDALALLRDRHAIEIPLLCSGTKNSFFPVIEARLKLLKLQDLVKFSGFVSVPEIVDFYSSCTGVVFPSFFEGWGMPVCEALWAGAPVACSSVTSLPRLVGDSAILFDPANPSSLAEAMLKLWTDEELRRRLGDDGPRRVSRLTWKRSALICRALYRKVAGRTLSKDDQELLSESPFA